MNFMNFLYNNTQFLHEVKETASLFISNPVSVIGNIVGIFKGFMQENPAISVITTTVFIIITALIRLQVLYHNWKKHEAGLERERIKLQASIDLAKEESLHKRKLLEVDKKEESAREQELHDIKIKKS